MTTTAEPLLGVTEPRLFTPPLRELTKETSLGFECVAFGTIVLGITFDPWQVWFLIHALELNEDGTFRFRTILLLVARQNGKTTVMQALTMWAMFTGRVKLVVGTAQDLDVAREAWDAVRFRILGDPDLLAEAPRGYIVTSNGKEQIRLRNESRYKIKATTEDAARGIPGVGLVLMDELRTHKTYGPWAAISNTTMAIPNAIIVGMSNAGTDDSIVLNDLRELALANTDPSMGLFEYSAPDGCELDDREGWRQANPSLGHGRLTERALESAMRKSPAAIFRIENLCQRVQTTEHAIDPNAWRSSADPVDLGRYREARWFGGLDVSLDGRHVTLTIGTPVRRVSLVRGDPGSTSVRVWTAASWNSVDEARADLPRILAALQLSRLGWCPSGPAAELATVIRGAVGKSCELVEFQGIRLSEACMGLAGAVRSRLVLHQGDALLNSHVGGASKLWQGDRFVFTRRGPGNVDAAYALSFLVHVTMAAPAPNTWTGQSLVV